MPRIQAPTVAEHRARQRAALLRAARELLAETDRAPSLAEVGARAGLARTSVYQYFDDRDDLMAAVVADVFPGWTAQVRARIAAAGTAHARLLAYVAANLELFAGPDQAVARALAKHVDPAVLAEPMREFHISLQEPLLRALTDLGEPDPEAMAEVVDAAINRAAQRDPVAAGDLLHRLLSPYARSTARRE